MPRVAVAMSGGVDSSTAAALLAEEGHEVVGLTLRLWDYSEENLAAGRGRCCSPADIADARAVSAQLGVRHYVFDHSDGFREKIVGPFVEDYLAGVTPSPCIRCNRHVKFDTLWKLARGLDADYLATGHYARLDGTIPATDPNGSDRASGSRTAAEDPEHGHAPRPQLRKARDHDKDQSYFLFDVPAERFNGVLFPLGPFSKQGVRDEAHRLGLAVADKPESYELCFIPDGDKNRFVEAQLPTLSNLGGPIRHIDGRTIGAHQGLHRVTIGQRRGLGINGHEPLYVVDIEVDRRAVVVGPASALEVPSLTAGRCNWVSIEPPSEPLKAAARIRHRHAEVPSMVTPLEDGRVHVAFDTPQRAVTPGQGVAFYDGDLLLGGGWIERDP